MLAMVVCASFAQAKEKQYIDIAGQKYLRCQPVQDYYGKANDGTVGSATNWWMIKMQPAAVWNAPFCAARGDELLFSSGKPVTNKICNNPVIEFQAIAQAANIPVGGCNDIPWSAISGWADFPEGAVGIETQLRPEINGYKFKLVTRRGDNIYATQCFKDTRLWTLSELGQKWGRNFIPFKTYGNTGDGGKFATLMIGIAQ